jgi:hypothetical protein
LHDHTGRTETALRGALPDEFTLQNTQALLGQQPFYRDHLSFIAINGKHQAGVHRSPVDENRTGTAFALSATMLCPRQLKFVTQH